VAGGAVWFGRNKADERIFAISGTGNGEEGH
jgi:hypothetical protein